MESRPAAAAPTLTLLGSGTSMGVPMVGCECGVCTSEDPRDSRYRAAALIRGPEGNAVIDTPPELRLQLVRERVGQVHAALFTHAHADHVVGLDDLRICGLRLKRAVPLYCEAAVEEHLRGAFHYAFAPPNPAAHPGSVPQYEARRLAEPFDPIEVCGLSVRPLRLYHGKLPVLGFRVGEVAYCTDVSRIPEETWPHLEGLETLILGALREEPHPTHFNLEQAVAVAERVRPRRTFFTHISHSLPHAATSAKLPEGVELAYDGLSVPVA